MNNKIIQKLVNDVQSFMESNYHWDNYTNYIACNVKLRKEKQYCMEDEIEEICQDMKLSEAKTEYIMEVFDNNHLNRLHLSWLEYECEYLHDDYLNGKCCFSSSEWYDKEIEKKKDNIKEVNSLKKWKKKDNIAIKHIDVLNQYGGLEGFFGRMGGWYAILDVDVLQNLINEIDGTNEWEDKVMFYNDLKDLYNACEWVKERISGMVGGLNFEEEVKFRIEEELETQGFIEDSDTVNYAIN